MTRAGTLLSGRATVEGTRRYAEKVAARVAASHFRELAGGGSASTLGLGTYLGPEDGPTDVLYQDAIVRALQLGVNVLDTAVNYRHQRSERAIRTALGTALSRGVIQRDEVIVATKGGFIPFDGAVPRDPRAYFASTYVETGIVKPGEVAKGAHCMTPRYLRDQIDRSRANLGLETLDVYYVHNPETQLGEVDRPEFMTRVRAAFGALEEAVAAGSIARYGTATWTGYRVDPSDPGYLSLPELVEAARDDRSLHASQSAREGPHGPRARGGARARCFRDGRGLAPSGPAHAAAAGDGGVHPGIHHRRAAGDPVRALDARRRHGARRHEDS